MRLLFAFFTIAVLSCITPVYGQADDMSSQKARLFNNTPQEDVFVHVNTTFLFPGEYLLYKIYTLNREENKWSDISKIAYVELIGENGEQVFKHKVKLEEGIGQADFFIPTNTPSGNYKLVAYTNWMKNVKGNYFDTDITIINPYQSQQTNLIASAENEPATLGNRVGSDQQTKNNAGLLSLELNKNKFENRDRVLLKIHPEENLEGNFSVSVRKLTSPYGMEQKSAVSFMQTSEKGNSQFQQGSFYLPELRGQLITGKISALEDGILPAGQKIALSIPENSFPLIGRTNGNGEFFFNLDKDIRGKQATLEVLGENKGKFKIELFNSSGIDDSSLKFGKFHLTPEMEEMILQRSIHNQIENAFFRVKPDTLKTVELEESFLKNNMITYNLDDYTRFKTIPETFVEIINSAWVRRDTRGNKVFEVRGLLNNIAMGKLPMIIIDGLLIQDHADLFYLDAFKVQSISIVREKVFVGPEIYQGVILVETIDQDFYETYSKEFVNKIELKQPKSEKRYFQQKYQTDSTNSRIPDFRYQLYWQPNLDLTSEEDKNIEFFTSDVNGDFQIILEGFTKEGQPVSLRKNFSVE